MGRKSIRDYLLGVDGRWYRLLRGGRTFAVMEGDWDNLILLDACRYDMFASRNILPGQLRQIYSKGSNTNQFLRENFKGRHFGGAVYVTANPLVDHHVPEAFFKIVSVWRDGWYEPFGTVLPETMAVRARAAAREFPDKRLIVHFMQPHFPFIGRKSRELIGEHEGILSRNYFLGGKTEHTQDVWKLFEAGKLTRSQVWAAYEENLAIVMEHVKSLLPDLPGRTVVTSDHGNLFGQRLFPFPLKMYGHPVHLYHPDLIKVPWLVTDNGERKIIREEPREDGGAGASSEEYADKLKSLGYM
jgi:hypothetical protein